MGGGAGPLKPPPGFGPPALPLDPAKATRISKAEKASRAKKAPLPWTADKSVGDPRACAAAPSSPEYLLSKQNAIDKFRRTNGLQPYRRVPATTGTVALIEVGGQTFFGINSTLDPELYSLSLEERRGLFAGLKSAGRLQEFEHLGDAMFLSHAEAEALIKAHKSQGGLPPKVVIHSDRSTCNNCREHLGELAGSLGVKEVHIYYRNQDPSKSPFVIHCQ